MAYFDRGTFPFLSRMNGLGRDAGRASLAQIAAEVSSRDNAMSEQEKPARTVHFGNHGKGARLYELPQPQYATVQEVRRRLGAVASSIVENFFAGDATSLDGLGSDELVTVREIAAAKGAQLP